MAFSPPFSHQQLVASINIQKAFRHGNYAVLKGQCQGGKTGAFQSVIQDMLTTGEIVKAFILCGSAETELYKQAIQDTHHFNHDQIDKIQILFHPQMTKMLKQNKTISLHNTLIVLDESHMVQGKEQKLAQFLARCCGGITMDGNPAPLQDHTYILSVSATPFSELSALKHQETSFPKHVEHLEPGAGYFGLAQYLASGKLRPTVPLTRSVVAGLVHEHPKKYIIMRLPSTQSETSLKMICTELSIPLLEYSSTLKQVSMTRVEQMKMTLPCIADAPTTTSIILIKGLLRAGKVICKYHIGCVWEGSRKSKTDTLLQGLLGRMCGYETAGAGNAIIYVPPSALKRHEDKKIKLSEMERAVSDPETILPQKAMNLRKTTLVKTCDRTICVPIRLPVPEEMHGAFPDEWNDKYNREDLVKHAMQLLIHHKETLRDCPTLTTAQKEEVLTKLDLYTPEDINGIHIRNFHGRASSFYKNLKTAYEKQCAPTEHVSNHDTFNFMLTYRGFKQHEPNVLLLVLYTNVPGNVTNDPINDRIAQTNGRSMFSTSSSAAIVKLRLNPECTQSAERFETCMTELIGMTTASEITFDTTFRFDKALFGYTDRKKNKIQEICAKIGKQCNLTVSPIFTRTLSVSTHFTLKAITWTSDGQ
jgi:hypothetical protein